ncbi:MAG TPA: hypothetical protein EYP86_04640 [Candidatus Altiarchaeales archaeon]|nr:hypothetical protein [Candidatus Altiarchaeales archaeon]
MVNTIFIPCYSNADPLPPVRKALRIIGEYKSIGIISTVQHSDKLERVGKFLEENGKNAVIGGNVLGCDVDNAMAIERDIDCFLYIGSGKFHPISIALKTEKPVFVANPISNSVGRISEDEKRAYNRRRKGRILKSMDAYVFGIIVCTKTGQFNMNIAMKIKKNLDGIGKMAFIFSGNEITPDKLLGFGVDVWVNTACPRLCDDYFDKPVLNPDELKIIINSE